KSLEVNGYKLKELISINYQSERELLLNFISWIKKIDKITLSGQNVNFDLTFLNSTGDRENIKWDFGIRVVDIHSVAYTHMISRGIIPSLKEGASKLDGDSIMDYIGIPS